jgi:hypothetical protein
LEHIGCHRVDRLLGAIPPRKLAEPSASISNKDPAACRTETYESNVKGLYIIGALGGYPLIKQAMNQGYEVVESIIGNHVEPADEPPSDPFAKWAHATSVAVALAITQRNVPLLRHHHAAAARIPARQRCANART